MHRIVSGILCEEIFDFEGQNFYQVQFKFLHIPADQLWLPDMAIYNNADGDFIISELVRAKVYHDGSVSWRPPIISKTFCEIRVADFPFDTQNCTLKIGTWTHDKFMVDITSFDNEFNNN